MDFFPGDISGCAGVAFHAIEWRPLQPEPPIFRPLLASKRLFV